MTKHRRCVNIASVICTMLLSADNMIIAVPSIFVVFWYSD